MKEIIKKADKDYKIIKKINIFFIKKIKKTKKSIGRIIDTYKANTMGYKFAIILRVIIYLAGIILLIQELAGVASWTYIEIRCLDHIYELENDMLCNGKNNETGEEPIAEYINGELKDKHKDVLNQLFGEDELEIIKKYEFYFDTNNSRRINEAKMYTETNTYMQYRQPGEWIRVFWESEYETLGTLVLETIVNNKLENKTVLFSIITTVEETYSDDKKGFEYKIKKPIRIITRTIYCRDNNKQIEGINSNCQ